MTDEEFKEYINDAKARYWSKLELLLKERRSNFLRRAEEQTKEWAKEKGATAKNLNSDEWWEYIPEDEPRHALTGLYMTPPVDSQVSTCKDHPFVKAWMREEGVFGTVLSVLPPRTITARDKNGQVLFGKNGEEVRMPGIPLVEVAFPEEDYQGGLLLPADCLKVREDYEEAEREREEAEEDDE